MSSSLLSISPSNKARFCLFIPFTRFDFVEQMIENINSMYLPRKEMEVVFYVDTDDKRLWDRLYQWCVLNQFVYSGMKMVKSNNPQPPDYDGSDASLSNTIPRRSRIVAMKEDSKQYIEASDFVFGLEDDTRVPHQAFEFLFEHFEDRQNLGFVMGVQQGRWNLPVLGAWRLDDVDNPTVMRTVPFKFDEAKGPAVGIDGGGYFCYLTPVELYKAHKYYWHDEPFGPDSTYGIELRRKGYVNLMDFRVICEHMTPQGILFPSPQNTVESKWVKRGSRWIRE